jgi:hypothetical protein
MIRPSILIALTTLAGFGVLSTAASAADPSLPTPRPFLKAPAAPVSLWTAEVGARYWYSSGQTKFDYHTGPSTSSPVVSRLDYDRLDAHSGEGFFRVDGPYRIFVKGYAGFGATVGGHLYDEDFPPYFTPGPYTKTVSSTKGDLGYGAVDLGYTFYDGRESGVAPVRFGGFVGYHYWHEKTDARGCEQIGGGWVCAGGNAMPNSVTMITENDTYHSVRLGGVADVWLTPALKLTAEAAYINSRQTGSDTHFFTFGTMPMSGHGDGVQLEGVLSYAVTDHFDVGAGGRWWHLTSNAVDSSNQALSYRVERFGGFLQGSYRF